MRDYIQQLTVEQFGGMVATATRTVGSGRGPYLGYTPTGAPLPVRFDPTQAPREDRASAVLLIGTLGSRQDGRGAGDRVRRRAPRVAGGGLRPEARPRLHKLPELDGRMQVLELSGDPAQQGKLDPLAIGLDDMREELACSYLLGAAARPRRATWENAVSLAVKDTVREGSRSLSRVVELLRRERPCRRPGSRRGVGGDPRLRPRAPRDSATASTTTIAGGSAGHDDPYARPVAPGTLRREGHLHPCRAGLRRDALAGRGVRAAADLRRPLAAQGRRPGRDLVPAGLPAGAAGHQPPRPVGPRVQRDAAAWGLTGSAISGTSRT